MVPLPVLNQRTGIVGAWIALCFIWGSTYLAIRVGVAVFPPFWMAGTRFLVAGAAMLAFARLRHATFPASRGEYVDLVAIGLFLTSANALVTWGEQRIPSGLAALIGCTGPIVIALMAQAAPRGERLRPRGWIGLALGFCGLVLLLRPSGGGRLDPTSLAALFVAVVLWGSGTSYSRMRAPKCDPVAGTSIEMLVGSAFWLIVAAATEHRMTAPVNLNAVLAVAYLIVFGSCIAFTLFFYLLRHVPAPRASTYAYVNPVIAVLLGWAILRETFSPSMALGTAITLAGVFLTNSGRAPAATKISRPGPAPHAGR